MLGSKLKKSKQRDAILEFLKSRKDHPNADTVYENVRKEFPNISLGTVYRNLTLLADIGKIQKLRMGAAGQDRFDYNTVLHYHFVCKKCGAVLDMEMDNLVNVDHFANKKFKGRIDGHVAYFYGLCEKCLAEEGKEL
jgi:Fur family peroxide stress response transcriptional regulator